MNPRTFVLAAFALLGLASFAPIAGAQDLTPERVQYMLDVTDRRIEQAEMALASVDNERASQLGVTGEKGRRSPGS